MLFKKMPHLSLSLFSLLFITLFSCCHATDDHQKDSGTIIVSYRTADENSDNLDRIRFLLINNNDQRKMYPQGKSYVDDPSTGMRMVLIENVPEGNYKIEFLLPNTKESYEAITPKEFHITSGGVVKINQTIRTALTAPLAINDSDSPLPTHPTEQLAQVPAGKAIVGDPFKDDKGNESPPRIVDISTFKIGIYEVTNAQFAQWLNKALAEGKIKYNADGTVIDTDTNILFRTLAAEPLSNITFSPHAKENAFSSTPGKNKHPVIHVTWHGAALFCTENGCRLPTEAEWEKAAGMALSKGNDALKRYKYGFSQDAIDKSWANYKDNDDPIRKIKVNTTEVGFYNGKNILPLQGKDHHQKQTHNARSPVGAYDMSGNVWEWTNDWFSNDAFKSVPEKDPKGPLTGTHKVAKGGCYDSLPDGVRVSERLAAPADYSDEFTGFRVAM